jgi:hypothetical protein
MKETPEKSFYDIAIEKAERDVWSAQSKVREAEEEYNRCLLRREIANNPPTWKNTLSLTKEFEKAWYDGFKSMYPKPDRNDLYDKLAAKAKELGYPYYEHYGEAVMVKNHIRTLVKL